MAAPRSVILTQSVGESGARSAWLADQVRQRLVGGGELVPDRTGQIDRSRNRRSAM
jgi:hypothetical protein